MEYGAIIERGEILSVTDSGYTVASLDREGIESPPIFPTDERSYTVGDTVYFFLFRDGTGRILCKA